MNLVDGASLLASILDDDTDDLACVPAQTVCAFEIKKFVLQILLDKAATVVPNHDVMPVLKCFRIEASSGRLRIIATDMELSIIATTALVSVEHPGVAVFPARKLREIIKTADDGDVRIKVVGTTAHISIGRARWSLKLQGGDDYPPMPQINEVAFTTVDRPDFFDAIRAVRYAASRDPNRASLNMLDIRNGKITGCDGARFQQSRVPDIGTDMIIPIGAVDVLVRQLKIADLDTIEVGQSANHLIFRLGGDVFMVNKFVAACPDMESMLLRPALENKHPLSVDRDELNRAIRRARITADTESSAIALDLTPGDPGQLTVTATDKYGNTTTETIEAGWNDPARTVVVNHAFLTDMLAGYQQQTCTFRLGDDTRTRRSPVLLTDEQAGTVGVLQQMISDWVGQ